MRGLRHSGTRAPRALRDWTPVRPEDSGIAAPHRARERLQATLLLCEHRRLIGSLVAAVERDLCPGRGEGSTSRGRSRSYASGAGPSAGCPWPAMTKNVDAASRDCSIRRIRSKLQLGSVPRSLWNGTPTSARASRIARPGRPVAACPFSLAAAPRMPVRVHRQGASMSWLSATAKRAPRQRGGSRPRRRRKRSSGGSSGSSADRPAGNRPCRSRWLPSSSTRERWKNDAATSSSGNSPRPTCSQARSSYGMSSPNPMSVAPTVSSTQRARRSTLGGITSAKRRRPPGRAATRSGQARKRQHHSLDCTRLSTDLAASQRPASAYVRPRAPRKTRLRKRNARTSQRRARSAVAGP